MYQIKYTKQATKDIEFIKAAGLSKKVKELIEIIKVDPFKSPPIYEGLVGNLDGFYSRRINIKHRLVYQVYGEKIQVDDVEYEGTIKIIRMCTHYEVVK